MGRKDQHPRLRPRYNTNCALCLVCRAVGFRAHPTASSTSIVSWMDVLIETLMTLSPEPVSGILLPILPQDIVCHPAANYPTGKRLSVQSTGFSRPNFSLRTRLSAFFVSCHHSPAHPQHDEKKHPQDLHRQKGGIPQPLPLRGTGNLVKHDQARVHRTRGGRQSRAVPNQVP